VVVAAPSLKHLQPWTSTLVAGVLLIYWLPDLGSLLVYDRAAIAVGQAWRLATGNLVHFSVGHLVCNLIVFAIAGWIIESRYRGAAPALYALCAVSIGMALYVAEPRLVQFGGTSGLAYGALTYLALRGFGELRWRPACVALLAAISGKLFAEWWWGWSLVDLSSAAGFVTVPLSHAAGAAAAVVLFFHHRRCGRKGVRHAYRRPEANARLPSSQETRTAA
jgi:rhomboid family GlyGly-CTERM serine protease